ncbi:MAG: DEAD/DEAH box helicase [Crocinitomicaceae bacterium]|nr:DEAD/DEAH box helicase [Crocinitomicaceae bacterium]
MSFKKVKPEVVEALKFVQIEQLDGDSKRFFSSIKSGKNLVIYAPINSGKTTTALVSIFNKVNSEYEGSPRVIYLTSTPDNAETIYNKAKIICRKLDITADLAHDKGNMIQQRNDIFDGTEIIIGNPKRVYDLYIQNGINIALLDLFIIDDLDACLTLHKQAEMKRLIESLEKKTQLIFFTNAINNKIQSFIDNIDIQYDFLEASEAI